MKEFRLIRVSAPDSFGRGEQYGEQAAHEIRLCIETYKDHLSGMRRLDWQTAREEAMKYLPLVGAALPVETEMLRGVARGSGADFEDLMVLNTRYEILHYPKNECTAFAVLRSAAADNKVFVGQNWDQRPIITPHSVLLHVILEDGTKIMGMTEAGQLLRNGMNSNGLGMVSNGLHSSRDSREIGVPGNFMRMRALRSKTFEEMTEVVTAFHRSVANNYLLASTDDRALDIECIPGMPVILYPEHGIVTHANHILSHPELDVSKGKKFRDERLGELLRQNAGNITADRIKECLRDHKGYPDSICSHLEEGATNLHRAWMTIASILYNLDDLEMEVCRDNPCTGEYKKYRLSDF
jgi:isopenicillin-N N-acyltransferase-like protein